MKFILHTASKALHRRLIAWLALCVIGGLLLPFQVQAQTCSLGSVTANPKPAAIKVPSTLTAGQNFFVTTISATFSCTGSNGQGTLFFPPKYPGQGAVSGPTNVSVDKDASSGSLTNISGPCTTTDQWGLMVLRFTGNGTCTGKASMILNFLATAAGGVSGTIPATMNVPTASDQKGWMSIVRCNGFFGQTCSYISPATTIAFGNMASGIPITSIANTCTLVGSASRIVTLPTVPLSTFSGIGSTAGQTLVNLAVNCPVAGAAALNFQLLYPGSLDGTTTIPYLFNSASAPKAAGIGVVIMDKTGAVIASGQSIQIASSVANGVNGIDLVVGYYQWGSSPSVGNVQGVATFSFTYN